ncbi:DUF167 domain-containing protein [Patescibacteria group bacterium]|nr:DUF167 domain-containing protein [Patescibacteria group bacterium]
MSSVLTKITVTFSVNAKSTGIDTISDTKLHIRFTQPPKADKFNQVISQMLARYFNVPLTHVVLQHGEKLPKKTFLIIGK